MKVRRIVGICMFAAGIFLIVYAVHAQQKVTEAKGIKSDMEEFFHNNPSMWNGLIEFFGGETQKKLERYDAAILAMLISGVLCIIAGSVVTVYKPKR